MYLPDHPVELDTGSPPTVGSISNLVEDSADGHITRFLVGRNWTANVSNMSGDIEAQPLPPWELPKADAIVTVRAIDTTTDMCSNAVNFVEPVIPGHEQLNMTTLAFLIEHQSTDQKVLFDAGSRKDYWNFPPFIFQSLLKASLGLKIEKNVSEILHGGGVDLKDVQAIIWRYVPHRGH